MALYEPDAILVKRDGGLIAGSPAIRRLYRELLARRPRFTAEIRPSLRVGDLALTSTRFSGGATAEVVCRQPDGSWLWLIDQPNVY